MSYRTWHDFDDYDDIRGRYGESYLKEQGVRYGLDPTDRRYQREDTGSQEAFDQDGHFYDDLMKLANNDFDWRMSSQAAKLQAGDVDYEFADKKWSEMSDSEREGLKREEHMANKEAGVIPDPRFENVPNAINSLEDLFYANKFMKDTWDDEKLGDKDYKRGYGTSDQRARVTDFYVNADRNKLLEDITAAKEEETAEPEVAPIDPNVPIALSEDAQKAVNFVDNHSWLDNYSTMYKARNEGKSPTVENDFLDKYKLNLIDGMQKAAVPTRGPGAVGTPGGFAS